MVQQAITKGRSKIIYNTKIYIIIIYTVPSCTLEGNRIVSLALLGDFISTLTQHAVQCKSSITFLGDSQRQGLASTPVSQCLKCKQLFHCHTSKVIVCNEENHYATNIGAVLAQISTGGGANHLEEQLSCVAVPSLSKKSFIHLERTLGSLLEAMVSQQLLSAGEQERQLAVLNGCYHNRVPATTVVVDAGWSKRSHKHSYNAKCGVGIIFGAATKKLLFIGVRNKYCSVCAISEHQSRPTPSHHCLKNWSGSSCAMEADIILEGFKMSESMHGLRYLWFIGDGDSSVYNSLITGVPTYGRNITKVECANHAVKCYRNRLEALCKEKPHYQGRNGLTVATMKRITHGARCAIRMHSITGDVSALRHDLRNGPRHCFGDHRNCNSAFCKHVNEEPASKL